MTHAVSFIVSGSVFYAGAEHDGAKQARKHKHKYAWRRQ